MRQWKRLFFNQLTIFVNTKRICNIFCKTILDIFFQAIIAEAEVMRCLFCFHKIKQVMFCNFVQRRCCSRRIAVDIEMIFYSADNCAGKQRVFNITLSFQAAQPKITGCFCATR